jgi:predicted nuclease of restriction endonuclease-like (RecB) superfamily
MSEKIVSALELEKNFAEIKNLIDQARNRAVHAVNAELVTLYLHIGKYILEKLESSSWGEKIVERLSDYLIGHGPNYKGFNRRNLYRMKQFYEAYHGNKIVSPLVTQLSWSNHLLIISKTKSAEEREFYIKLAIDQKYWSIIVQRERFRSC